MRDSLPDRPSSLLPGSFIGCELNPEYAELARERIIADSPLHNTHAEMAA